MFKAMLVASNEIVTGHRIFDNHGKFLGLYDKKHNDIWAIKVDTLCQIH